LSQRLALHVAGATALLLGSLLIGIVGYGYFEDLTLRDGFVNSAMLLGGMEPVDAPRTDGGKDLRRVLRVVSGLVFIVAAGQAYDHFDCAVRRAPRGERARISDEIFPPPNGPISPMTIR
jgi:hypothetical protein